MKEVINWNEQQVNRLILNINWLSAIFGLGLFYLKKMYNINDVSYFDLNLCTLSSLIICLIVEVLYRKNKDDTKLKYLINIVIVLIFFMIIVMSKEAFMLGLYFYPLIAAGLYYTRRIIVFSILLNLISITILISQNLMNINLETQFIAFFTGVMASFMVCIFVLFGHLTQSTRFMKLLQKQENDLQEINLEHRKANINMNIKKEQLITLNQKLILSNEKLEKACNELQHTQEQIVQHEKMASIGELSAGVAHEINTPIGAIKSNIELSKYLINDLDKEINEINDKKVKNIITKLNGIVETSMQSCNRIEQVAISLRNFARQDGDICQEIDIHILVENTLVLLNNKLRDKIELVKEYENLQPIQCYPGQLSQVLMNIIQNAVESIEQKGIITIKTEEVENGIYIRIKDNGRGIEKEKLDKLFDLNFTAKENRMRTGLGLATAYKIIENHNGSIEIKTKVGEGTEVIIFLPRQGFLEQIV